MDDSATVGDLLDLIQERTTHAKFDVRVGYPPQALQLNDANRSQRLADLDVRLDGEQLIVSPKESDPKETSAPERGPSSPRSDRPIAKDQPGQVALGRKKNQEMENDPPEVASPQHQATLVLRIMPDDNSCLFRAFGSAAMGAVDSMTELRSLIAQTIQSQPEAYSAAVLDQSPDEYCKWIQSEYSWGGGIELSILSKHFDIEICSIDVKGLRVDRFNEGRLTRCVLVYSGIHYDLIALSPSEPPYTHAASSPDFDTKVFDTSDDVILEGALKLCRMLRGRNYYTDTATFTLKCNICGEQLVGESGATQHATATGHMDFGEAG